jgi:hypothetical protein
MANRNTVATANRNTDLEERVNQLEERITALETQCNETLPALIETKANEARDCAVADAVAEATKLAEQARVEAIAEAARLAQEAREGAEATAKCLVDTLAEEVDRRLDALEEQTNRELPELIDRKAKEAHDTAVKEAHDDAVSLANQAREGAEATAKGLVDALSTIVAALSEKHDDLATLVAALSEKHDDLATLVAALSTKHDGLATKVAELKVDVDYLKDPQTAAEAAANLKLPLYRSASVDELRAKVDEDKKKPQVLIEIAKRLNPGDNTDSKVLTNMFTFVVSEGGYEELMAELVTFSGAGPNTPARALGGSRNGR